MHDVLLTDLLAGALSRESGVSLQKQIYDLISRAILNHSLLAGQKLPSSRTLAQDLAISRVTVALAYERLINENYLTAEAGSGTFVAPTMSVPLSRGSDLNHSKNSLALSQRGRRFETLPGGLKQSCGAFVPGVADVTMFPFHLWKRLIARHLGKTDIQMSGYAMDGGGYGPLREAISSYLNISRSVNCSPEQVIITSGTNHSIDLCARLLADPGDTAIVENPCHWAFPTVLAASGLDVVGSEVDAHGLALKARDVRPGTRLVVTSPSHQYPTGVVMPLMRRLQLLQTARSCGLWVIEDDYDSEFRYDAQPIASLQGLDVDSRVIYAGTLSKAMFAGVRFAYLVVPAHVVKEFCEANAKIYRPGQIYLQAALADFLNEGHFAQHIRRMRQEYAERQRVLRQALHRVFGDTIALSNAQAGLHLYAEFKLNLKVEDLIESARKEGVILGHPKFITPHSRPNACGVVLGYGAVPVNNIEDGVNRLARAVQNALPRGIDPA